MRGLASTCAVLRLGYSGKLCRALARAGLPAQRPWPRSRLLEPRFYNGVPGDSNRADLRVLRYLRAGRGSARVYGPDTLPSLDA